RFAPLVLPDSKQLRLKRYYPDAVYKSVTHQVSVPRPATARIGGGPPRDPPRGAGAAAVDGRDRRRAAARPSAAQVVPGPAHHLVGSGPAGLTAGSRSAQFPGKWAYRRRDRPTFSTSAPTSGS